VPSKSIIFGIIPFAIMVIVYPVLVNYKLSPMRKKKAVRIFGILWGISYLSLTIIPSIKPQDAPVLIFIIPAVSLMVFLLIRYTKVCPKCGHTVSFAAPYVEPKVCPRCSPKYELKDVED
jgi:hypothetical protein